MYSDESMLLRAAAADSTRRNASNSYTRHFSPLLREKKKNLLVYIFKPTRCTAQSFFKRLLLRIFEQNIKGFDSLPLTVLGDDDKNS